MQTLWLSALQSTLWYIFSRTSPLKVMQHHGHPVWQAGIQPLLSHSTTCTSVHKELDAWETQFIERNSVAQICLAEFSVYTAPTFRLQRPSRAQWPLRVSANLGDSMTCSEIGTHPVKAVEPTDRNQYFVETLQTSGNCHWRRGLFILQKLTLNLLLLLLQFSRITCSLNPTFTQNFATISPLWYDTLLIYQLMFFSLHFPLQILAFDFCWKERHRWSDIWLPNSTI